jgi:molybdopterin/thiamine biosynthesis adenylyltransferase
MRYLLSPNATLVEEAGMLTIVTERELLSVGDRATPVAAMLRLLETGCSFDQLLDYAAEEECRSIVGQLEEAGVLLHAGRDEFSDRIWERQYGYLASVTIDPSKAQRSLGECSVAIVGVGGVGGMLLQELLGAGVGRFHLIDPDLVAPHNLNRQFIYNLSSVGRPKVEVAADYARSIRPDVEITCIRAFIESPDDLAAIEPHAPDLLVIAADLPAGKIGAICAEYCRARRIPHIEAGVGIGSGYWGPLIIPGSTTCHRCFEMKLREEIGEAGGWALTNVRKVTPYSFGPTNAVITSLLAGDIIGFLAGAGNVHSLACRVVLDFRSLRFARLGVERCDCEGGVE